MATPATAAAAAAQQPANTVHFSKDFARLQQLEKVCVHV